MKAFFLVFAFLSVVAPSYGQDTLSVSSNTNPTTTTRSSLVTGPRLFIAYDLGEAVFNQFQSLGGEIGMHRANNHVMRLAFTYLILSEAHLSSNFAKAVDGPHVKGKQTGIEAFYDFPVFVNGLYIAPSAGYYQHTYTHTLTQEQLTQSSATLGAAISFTETDLFHVKGLYYRASIPFRFHLNPIATTKLGDTTINSNAFDNSIWFFVGYQFRNKKP